VHSKGRRRRHEFVKATNLVFADAFVDHGAPPEPNTVDHDAEEKAAEP
jgi:hypothetical protein